MKILIVEDELASRKFLTYVMAGYGECTSAVNGIEAVDEFTRALESGERYDLICMDIMMPEMDGQEALKRIRGIETDNGIAPHLETKVLMTTALKDPSNVVEAYYKGGASIYLTKPLDGEKIGEAMVELGFLKKKNE
ncbi:response regulator [Desulfovibrio sp. JC010]|uniref:response regulator n=1 Tax=Desulfovibrio sp. JC010 TaxID=2593641 RepID=UPI0013D74478|nr:response regulator [Desulfovibrio sp. JC010]NDV27305.1 response regulator [Desulfovibrio sp. JC010]